MHTVCVYKECGHTSLNSNCVFRKFPTENCSFRIWKKYSGCNEKFKKSEIPYLCSCHFEEENVYPNPYLVLNKRKTYDERESFECASKHFRVSAADECEQEQDIIFLFDDTLFENEKEDFVCEENDEISNTVDSIVVVHLDETCTVTNEFSASETPLLSKKLSAAEIENEELKIRIEKLEEKLANVNPPFDMKFIENSDKKVFEHTGLPSKAIFDIVFNLLTKVNFEYDMGWTVVKISKRNQFLMTLMKLRMDLRHFDLAQRFHCCETTVSNIIRTWILAMYEILFLQLMKEIPSRSKNKNCLPVAFQTFSDCRIIFDCFEIPSDKPKKMDQQKATYSTYKHHVTGKNLIGIAPNGIITFMSEQYPGSTSDKKIVQHCGVTGKLVVGDTVMADKGFLIKEDLPYGVELNVPPFLTTPQFTRSQVRRTESIAKARIHVERAINKLKNFRILHYIPKELSSISTEIVQVCAALTNFQYLILPEISEYM